MKTKALILSLIVMGLSAFGVQAQESQKLPGRKTVYEQNGGRWFIDLQAGAAMIPFGDANGKAKFMDRLSVMPNAAFGQWHNPYFGTRAHAYAWNVYGFLNNVSGGQDRYSNIFGAGSLEFMFDLVNYFGHYTPKTWFHFIPFVGVGAAYKFYSEDANGNKVGTKNDYSPLLNGGLILKFRLGKRVDLNLEAQAMTTKNNYIGTNNVADNADVVALASAGLSFRLGKTDFAEVTPMDLDLINSLQGQINALRAENAELSKRPEYCPECPEVKQATDKVSKTVVEDVVYFRIGSYKIDQNQLINIYNFAQYAKENNSKIMLVGYADEDTGSADWNLKLSEKRANAVMDVLVNEYGIDADNIVVDFKGSSVQPYETNEWNRIVIMTAE